jgi:hypothetical protein
LPDPDLDDQPQPPERIAYLPSRAAKARKLILRSQLGVPWIVAAALFGMVILAAGTLFLVRAGHPGPPWARVAAVRSLPGGAVTQLPAPPSAPSGTVVVVDRRADALHTFLARSGPCPVTADPGGGFARPCLHQTWTATGTPAPSPAHPSPPPLAPVPFQLARGQLYVNLERRSSIGEAPGSRAETRAVTARAGSA